MLVASVLVSLPASQLLHAQARRTAIVCNPGNRCFSLDTTTIGGRRFEDYRVTNGRPLNPAQRRAILQTNRDAATALCGVTPFIGLESSLPTLRWRSATVRINTHSFTNAAGQRTANRSADVTIEDLQTSDGYAVPRFGFFFISEIGTTIANFQFNPSVDPNLTGIPGFTQDLRWMIDTSAQSVRQHPSLSQLPVNLRRLILAIAATLPNLYRQANNVEVRPNPEGYPVWTLGEVLAVATPVSQLIFSTPLVTPAPIDTLTCDNRLGTNYTICAEDRQLESFANFLMRYGAQYTYLSDEVSRQSLLGTFRNWAAANALATYPGYDPGDRSMTNGRLKYGLSDFVGFPLTLTWSALRTDAAVTEADRVVIDEWITRLVAFATSPYDQAPDVPAPNPGYLMKAVKMAWAIVTRDDVAFAEGVERYFMALHQMHPDGALMWEAERGPCALKYQAYATGFLVAIAEMAASQGYDLYSLDVDGRSIHTALGFLADAMANPALFDKYATTPLRCDLVAGSPPDLSAVAPPFAEGRTVLAHVEQYIARFPDSTNAARLRSVWPGGVAPYRPVFNYSLGLNTSCAAGSDPFVRMTLTGSTEEIPATGGAGIVGVRPSSPDFAWNAEASAEWISIPVPSGTGSAELIYHVLPNMTGARRTVTITIGNQVFPVSQARSNGPGM